MSHSSTFYLNNFYLSFNHNLDGTSYKNISLLAPKFGFGAFPASQVVPRTSSIRALCSTAYFPYLVKFLISPLFFFFKFAPKIQREELEFEPMFCDFYCLYPYIFNITTSIFKKTGGFHEIVRAVILLCKISFPSVPLKHLLMTWTSCVALLLCVSVRLALFQFLSQGISTP